MPSDINNCIVYTNYYAHAMVMVKKYDYDIAINTKFR